MSTALRGMVDGLSFVELDWGRGLRLILGLGPGFRVGFSV